MIKRTKIPFGLLIVVLLSLAWAVAPVSGGRSLSVPNLPPDVEQKARLLTEKLTQQGFEVLQGGSLQLITVDDCPASYQEMKLCYGNNPAAPYVLVSLPPWEKEFVDPATDTAFGYNTRAPYRFDPREAIVILGDLPPQAKYFGLQSYLFTRQGQYDKHSDLYQYLLPLNRPDLMVKFFTPVPQNDRRINLFASLGNNINNVVIEQQSGEAFDQERFFIITPDQFMDAAVRQALNEIAVAEQDIFTEPIPPGLDLGLNKPADEFVSIIRYAMPEDGGDPGTPSDVWRNTPPMAVLRVRDTQPGRQAEPFAPVILEARSYASELYLKQDLMNLAAAVAMRWGQPQALAKAQKFLILQQEPYNQVGPDCIEIGEDCLGDTQDTSYQYSMPQPITDNAVYAALGTLGTRTGNATYVGLGLTSSLRLLGFDNLAYTELEDTASAYSGQVDNTDKFFLYYFARDCTALVGLTDGACREIAVTDVPTCSDPNPLNCDRLTLSLRDYIVPDTRRGPDANYTLATLVIPFEVPVNP
jgi:hypothetical protein